MRTSLLSSALLLMILSPLVAADAPQKPTFTKDILPILQEKCQTCHRPSGLELGGMIAPMSFMNYQEVRPWAKSIAREVELRNMPPWDASPEFNGVFSNERTLTDDEITTLLRWVETGAPRGNPKDAPPAAKFADSTAHGWHLAEEPEVVLGFEKPVWVSDEVADWQPMFPVEVPEDVLTEDKWIRAVEFKPGSEVVHHIVGVTLTQGGGMIGGIAPGSELDVLPEGYGMLLKKGTKIGMGMHYNKEPGPGTGKWDSSSMALWFHDKPVHHDVRWQVAQSQSFEIPPGDSNHAVNVSFTFEEDGLLMAVSPHMHFRGKSSSYRAVYPDGTVEALIDVPKYDFNWQSHYTYEEPKFMPKGTRLEMAMVFDNSTDNAANPDPNATVKWGLETTAEMANAWFNYCNAEPFEDGEGRITDSGLEGAQF